MRALEGSRVCRAIKFQRTYSTTVTNLLSVLTPPPREIIYEDQKYRWGFQIPESILRQKLFKLDLDPDQLLTTALASRYHDPLKAPPTYDGGAVKIVEDYLTALRKHAEQVLRYKLPQSALTTTPIEYIVSPLHEDLKIPLLTNYQHR